jgi:ribosome modulation factor
MGVGVEPSGPKALRGAPRLRPAPKGRRSNAGYRKVATVGFAAFGAGLKIADCPFQGPMNPDRWAWLSGWCNAEDAAKAAQAAPERSSAEGSPS